MQAIEQQLLITEDKYITPLEEVLSQVTPKIENEQKTLDQPSESLKKSLDDLFPEQQYDDKQIQKTREILGEKAKEWSDTQLKDVIAEIQYLAQSWLDDYEREIFEGKTLKELLHEKGGL